MFNEEVSAIVMLFYTHVFKVTHKKSIFLANLPRPKWSIAVHFIIHRSYGMSRCSPHCP